MQVSVERLPIRFWRVRVQAKGQREMSDTATRVFGDTTGGFADVPLIVEDLLCQIEDLRDVGGDPAVIDDLLAQVALLQDR